MTYQPNTNILEVRTASAGYPGKFSAQVVAVEPNGLRHVLAGWQPVSGRRELKQMAAMNEATISEVA